MLQALYERTLRLAAGPNALPALLAVSFVESSFFPIPPDILLIPMILARPRAISELRVDWTGPSGVGFHFSLAIPEAFWLAALCTLASVLGGLLGYAIGYYLFDAVGR